MEKQTKEAEKVPKIWIGKYGKGGIRSHNLKRLSSGKQYKVEKTRKKAKAVEE